MRNMNRWLLGLLAVLVLSIVLPRVLPRHRDYPERLGDVDTTAVTKVVLARGADSVQVEKAGAAWRLTAPVAWAADPRMVEGLLAALGDLRVTALANANRKLEADARYELGDAQATRLKVYAGARLALEARLGRASQDYSGSFARLEGKEPIYRLAREVGSRLPANRSRWLDKVVCKVDADSLNAIELQRADGVLLFSRADSAWSVRWSPARGAGWTADAGDAPAFAGLRSTLCNLRMSDLPTPAQAAALALAEPQLSHALSLKDGRRLQFQWTRLEGERDLAFVRREGEAAWFAVYAGLVDRLEGKPGDFRAGGGAGARP